VSEIFFKSVNIWQSYKQKRDCLMHFACLANTLLNDEECARDIDVFARNFAKYSLILKFFSLSGHESVALFLAYPVY